MKEHLSEKPARPYDAEDEEELFDNLFSVASSTECTGLTPAEPEELEEAYALGELYAVHTLRPNENQPSQ